MAISLKVAPEALEKVDIEVKPQPQAQMDMVIRKTMGGNYAIKDHPSFDVVVMPDKNKILSMTKSGVTDDTYGIQSEMYDFLNRNGVIFEDSVRSGNVYNSLEATFPADAENSVDIVVFTIGKYMEEAKANFVSDAVWEEEFEDHLLEPNDEHSTEMGDVPHSANKGSINPRGQYPGTHGFRA
jgi:hypothetical protein